MVVGQVLNELPFVFFVCIMRKRACVCVRGGVFMLFFKSLLGNVRSTNISLCFWRWGHKRRI